MSGENGDTCCKVNVLNRSAIAVNSGGLHRKNIGNSVVYTFVIF